MVPSIMILIVNMASKMRLFQNIQKMYRMTGIQIPSSPQPSFQFGQKSLLNWKICLILMSQMALSSSTTAFFLFKSETVTDYGSSFSASLMILTNMLFFIVNILKISSIVELITEFENFIEQSECFERLHSNFA